MSRVRLLGRPPLVVFLQYCLAVMQQGYAGHVLRAFNSGCFFLCCFGKEAMQLTAGTIGAPGFRTVVTNASQIMTTDTCYP